MTWCRPGGQSRGQSMTPLCTMTARPRTILRLRAPPRRLRGAIRSFLLSRVARLSADGHGTTRGSASRRGGCVCLEHNVYCTVHINTQHAPNTRQETRGTPNRTATPNAHRDTRDAAHAGDRSTRESRDARRQTGERPRADARTDSFTRLEVVPPCTLAPASLRRRPHSEARIPPFAAQVSIKLCGLSDLRDRAVRCTASEGG